MVQKCWFLRFLLLTFTASLVIVKTSLIQANPQPMNYFRNLLLLVLGLSSVVLAQVPQQFRLQGVARDNGQLLTNQSINLRLTIQANGAIAYTETHAVTTDGYGQFTLSVGTGTVQNGTFASIPWAEALIDYFVEIDAGNGYAAIGMDDFQSVPYALVAGRVDSATLAGLIDVDTTGLQPGYVLKWNGSQWLPEADFTADGDSDPTNEYQSLSLTGSDLTISNGNTVTLPAGGGGSYTAGPGISITGSQIANLGDLDSTDDITVGSSASGDLSGNYPSPVVAGLQGFPVSAVIPSPGQVLKWNGSQWALAADAVSDSDSDPTNEIQILNVFGTTLSLSNGGGSANLSPYWTETGGAVGFQGTVQARNAGNQPRVEMGLSPNDDGFLNVYDNTGAALAGFSIIGGVATMFAGVKNFRMNHPEDPNKEIWYASLEGPEAGAYVRGTATLVNGRCEVQFPEHFSLIASPQSLTVMLTPLTGDSNGLGVVEKTADGFVVVELMNGQGSYPFDWEAKCVRSGYENYEVIRERVDR